MDAIQREEAEIADAEERLTARLASKAKPTYADSASRPPLARPRLSGEQKQSRREYIAWRSRGGKPAAKSRREKAEIVKPSGKPFCFWGKNGEELTHLASFPGCVSIYALIDPRDETVRYVGKTTCPELRLIGHLESAGPETRKSRWLAELSGVCLRPRMVILDNVSAARWESVEKRWIAFYAERGSLYNVEVGGRGYLHEILGKRNTRS